MSSPWFADLAPGFVPSQLADKFDELDVGEEEKGSVPVEAEGVDIPPPVTSFQEMRFSAKSLNDNIRRCNYVKPTPIQSHAIPVAMIGRDLMACAQTGSGKTAAFCFPIINAIVVDKMRITIRRISAGPTAFPVALILAPTRELSCQIYEEAKKFSYQTGVKVVVAYGGAPIFQQLQNLARGVDILVATPGRLVDLIERRRVSLKNVKYLALDEADRMLDMGFERQVRRIVQQSGMPPPGARQTMLFSATFPAEIKRLASDFLSNYIFLAAGKVGSSTTLIVQRVEYVPDMKKREYLINLLTSEITEGAGLTLIFVETKRGADALERWLCRQGYLSAAIHGDKVQVERERALRSFRQGYTPILIATNVAARGLDIPHVAHVINFDLPRAIGDYVHRIGRTGRAGKSGLATAFFNDKNLPIAKGLVELMQEASQQVPTWLTEYAQRSCEGSNRSSNHDYYRNNGFVDDNCSQYGTSMEAPYDDHFASSSGGATTLNSPYAADSYGGVTACGWDY
ncbi:hypothetical protein SASPL_153516 [Salvia splendens]|uniref:RNA helicase n=1 Tax=Salvia splendens TaxID=180675 RepID=A0A8X8W5Y3_SALSN|nr:DEAD-box ATP-dependent RNA helicase 52C-like [Salvia splendens]KAG6388314.1 hypothetical protein SASPL_153516 [Salvia splendens]